MEASGERGIMYSFMFSHPSLLSVTGDKFSVRAHSNECQAHHKNKP